MHDASDLPVSPSTGAGGEVVPVPEEKPARGLMPETLGGSLYLVMLVVAGAALLVVVLGDWRVGIRLFAGVLYSGAALRLVLPDEKAGMLAVRSRAVDVAMHTAVATTLVFLAGSIPDQPL